jgi:hypothetical protein
MVRVRDGNYRLIAFLRVRCLFDKIGWLLALHQEGKADGNTIKNEVG